MKKILFCKACGHIPIAKIVEETLQENKGILVGSVGCSVSLPTDMERIDAVSSAHGWALAVATAVRRIVGKDKLIITHQGDGDLTNIGIGSLVHTALRNEKIICVLINNQIFGMTGFQMSAQTQVGIKTKTCPEGREESLHGIPLNVQNFIYAVNPKVKYFKTTSASKEGIEDFKQYLHEAMHHDGFSIIEVISPCVTYWGNAKKAYEYSREIYVTS